MRVRHLAVAFALAPCACVRANAGAAATPIEIGNAAPVGPHGDVPPAKGACLVKTQKSTFDLEVRAGDEKLALRVIDLPTESEIERDGNAVVHVRSHVEFDGRLELAKGSDSSRLSLHVTRDITLLGGLVKLGTETEILNPRRVDDTATGVVLVGGYEIEDLPVPCDALAIDDRSLAWPEQLSDRDDDAWVGPHGDILVVCATPTGGPPCIRTKEMTFERGRREGGFVGVRARFTDGSVIAGWARADQVTKAEEPIRSGYGESGGCGCGREMLSHLKIGKPDPREHFGKATLRGGSSIYAVPELKNAWAKAATDVVIEIEMHGADNHARVRDLPGVSTTTGCTCPGMSDHAWVKRESVIPIR